MKLIPLIFSLLVLYSVTGCVREVQSDTREPEKVPQHEPVELFTAGTEEIATIDPHLARTREDLFISSALYETLLGYDPVKGEPKPALAESWSVSDNGLVYTFTLRTVSWSDGVPVTAESVRDSWLRLFAPSTASPWSHFGASLIEGAEGYRLSGRDPGSVGIHARDDLTLEVRLTHPSPFFPHLLHHPAFAVVPGHLIRRMGGGWTGAEEWVSIGPYVPEGPAAGSLVTLVRNGKYWNRDAGYPDILNYRVMKPLPGDTAEGVATIGTDRGAVDFFIGGGTEELEGSAALPPAQASPLLSTGYISVQHEEKPFSDPRVRKALALSINLDDMTEQLFGEGAVPAGGFVPSLPGYQGLPADEYNPEKARALLAEAGYSGGAGFPWFDIVFHQGETNEKVCAWLAGEWRSQLSIECRPVGLEWKRYLITRSSGNFQCALDVWREDYPDAVAFLKLFGSLSPWNDSRFSDREYDNILRNAEEEADPAVRLTMSRNLEERLLTQEQAVIPLYHPVSVSRFDPLLWSGAEATCLNLHLPASFRKLQ